MIRSTSISSYLTEIISADNTGGITVSFLSFTNVADTDSVLDVYLVKSGEIASNKNIFIKSLKFPINETLISEGEHIYLSTGDSILARCDGDITAVCSYCVN